MAAKAGIQVGRFKVAWIPAFAGMTIFIAENSPTPQLNIMMLSASRMPFAKGRGLKKNH